METEVDVTEVTPSVTNATAESLPATDEKVESSPTSETVEDSQSPEEIQLKEFQESVAKATGEETKEVEAEVEKEAETDEPATDKTEEVVLSQEKSFKDRPEWQAAIKIADKLGQTAGKEMRQLMRGMLKKESELSSTVKKYEPAVEVVREMFNSVQGNEQGFNNMRQLIRNFEANPADCVPQLKILLADAEKRAGLVIHSPELLTEAQQLDKQVQDGMIEPSAAEKRKKELLELENARSIRSQTSQQTEAQKQQAAQQAQTKAMNEAGAAEDAWTAVKTKSDPDFPVVKTVFDAFAQKNIGEFHLKENRIPNPGEVQEILEKSLKQAKDEAAKFRPKPKPRTVIHTNGNGSSGNSRQQPTTEFEKFQADIESATSRHRR